MNKKIFLTGLILLQSLKTLTSNDTEIGYQIINNPATRCHKTYTEEHFFHALELLLVHRNDGYISHDCSGIQISVWEKYHSAPTTIHPIYSMKLKRTPRDQAPAQHSREDRTVCQLNNKKINETLKACDIPEVVTKVKDMLLQEQFGMIQVQNSTITTIL